MREASPNCLRKEAGWIGSGSRVQQSLRLGPADEDSASHEAVGIVGVEDENEGAAFEDASVEIFFLNFRFFGKWGAGLEAPELPMPV